MLKLNIKYRANEAQMCIKAQIKMKTKWDLWSGLFFKI